MTVAAEGSKIADYEDEAYEELSWSYGLGFAGRMKHHHGHHDCDGAADHRTILSSESVSDHHYLDSSFHHDSFDSHHVGI